MSRTVLLMSILAALALAGGCETSDANLVVGPEPSASLWAGDALGEELMTHNVASVESEMYFASEPGDDQPE